MPKGSTVEKIYRKLRREGKSMSSAARIAQAATGKSLKTGRKPRRSRDY